MWSEPNGFIFRQTLLRVHSTVFDIQQVLWLAEIGSPLSRFEEYVVALEDRRFFRHRGIDFRALMRELRNLLTLNKVHGASTIEMQLFRTLSGRYERRLSRKLTEFIAAKAYQRKFAKLELLRAYLAVAYFGTGLTGAEMASLNHFGIPSSKLSHAQAAQLASMLVYPKPQVVNANWLAKIVRRAEYGRLIDWTRPK